MSIQNAPVHAGNTRTCFSAYGRVAGTHRDVVNVRTEACWELHTGRGGRRGRREGGTKKWPTLSCRVPQRVTGSSHWFENRSRTTCFRFLQLFALTDEAVGLQFS